MNFIKFPATPLFLALATGANVLKQESESQPKLLRNRLGPSTMFLGFGPVPAKILHAIVCVTLGEDLKDATSALQSFFAKN